MLSICEICEGRIGKERDLGRVTIPGREIGMDCDVLFDEGNQETERQRVYYQLRALAA